MVKHANNIRTKNCKAHQARLSFIGILILIFVITNILGTILAFFLDGNPVSGYVLVLHCRGLQATYDHYTDQLWFIILVALTLETLANYSCQVRVQRFRRSHSTSYFSKYRQNIATMPQLVFAGYANIIFGFLEALIALSLFSNIKPFISFVTFIKVNATVNSILIPCYWLYSARKDFPELFSEKTCFWNRNEIRAENSEMVPRNRKPLRPRDPCMKRNEEYFITSHSKTSSDKILQVVDKQAGAELCQAQYS